MIMLNSLDSDNLPPGCSPPPPPCKRFTRMKLLRGSCMMLKPLQERAAGTDSQRLFHSITLVLCLCQG